jgi:DNA-binding MarR family transcriptional regulator
MKRRASRPDPWGQRVVYLRSGVPVRRVPVSLARRFHQICAARAAEVAAREDITTLQLGALTYLCEETGLDQIGLAARLGIDRSSMSTLLDALEKRGLAERYPDNNDRRAKRLRVTASGRQMRNRLRPLAGAAQQAILECLPSAEREKFLDMLVAIIEANEIYARPGASRRKPRRKK